MIYNRQPADPSLGLNLYSGCSHDCLYCYNKREDRYQGPYNKRSKKANSHLDIERDLLKLRRAHDIRPVFISAVGDPYDMGREDNSYIRIVLHTFQECRYPFHLLTKGGRKAVRDFDLYKPGYKFGCTLTFDNPEDSRKWEPGAALPADRIAALKEAHSRGIQNWVSIEPVIYPEQSLHLIEMSNDFVDLFSVGMLSHHTNANWDIPEEWPTVDWPKFRNDVEALLKADGNSGNEVIKSMVNWHSWATTFFGMAIILFIGSFIYSFWALSWTNMGNYESVILNYLVDLVHYVALVGLSLLAAIFCALMNIGDRLKKGEG